MVWAANFPRRARAAFRLDSFLADFSANYRKAQNSTSAAMGEIQDTLGGAPVRLRSIQSANSTLMQTRSAAEYATPFVPALQDVTWHGTG